MANPYVNLYVDSVTPGVFNVRVSNDGSGSEPIKIGPLNTTEAEYAQKKVLLKTEQGYQTIAGENTFIKPVGATAARWKLAVDVNGVPGTFSAAGGSLTLSSQITSAGVFIWIRAESVEGEIVQNDTSVDIQVDYSIQAV